MGAAGFSLGGYTVPEVAGARTDLDQLEAFCAGRNADPNCSLPPEAPFSMEDLVRHIENDLVFRASMDNHHLSYRDPRVRSVVAMAPASVLALTSDSLERISVPVLILVGDRDFTAPADSNAERVAALIPGSRLEVLAGVGHYTFLAQCGTLGRVIVSLLCSEAPGISRNIIHEQVAERIRIFFDGTLGPPASD